jgi:uncharacterized protein (TIGR00255 family)
MPSSMTGFASAEVEADPFRFTWELRSVNHRFLDVGIRLPEELRRLEPRCKDEVSAMIRRGKIDVTLRVARTDRARPAMEIDEAVLEALVRLEEAVLRRCPQARPLTAGEILRWPGLLEEPMRAGEDIENAALDGLIAALRDLAAARAREGERLAEALRQRCAGIAAIVETVKPRLGAIAERYRAKLLERIERLELELEPERLEQEIALIAQRLDVDEELDRLTGHVQEVEATLAKNEPIGRRIDFIVQELNREANTFASKIQDEDLARRAVELKVLIEQMREQAQNLE